LAGKRLMLPGNPAGQLEKTGETGLLAHVDPELPVATAGIGQPDQVV